MGGNREAGKSIRYTEPGVREEGGAPSEHRAESMRYSTRATPIRVEVVFFFLCISVF